jgi:hypothetical protein
MSEIWRINSGNEKFIQKSLVEKPEGKKQYGGTRRNVGG